MESNENRVLLDCGKLLVGTYKFAVSRMGSQDGTELERLEFYARVTDDGALELSQDGRWSRFSSGFSDAFRKEGFYQQFMRGLNSVPDDAKVLDVRGMLDTAE